MISYLKYFKAKKMINTWLLFFLVCLQGFSYVFWWIQFEKVMTN